MHSWPKAYEAFLFTDRGRFYVSDKCHLCKKMKTNTGFTKIISYKLFIRCILRWEEVAQSSKTLY